MIRRIVVMVVALICLLAGVARAEVQRLYVLDCGRNVGRDQGRWSPGVNEGKPIEFSDNCYLIRHTKGWLLWDTGVPDVVATMPDGWSSPMARSRTGGRRRSPSS
jgi:N-acyl homoserine lactone hydrolase